MKPARQTSVSTAAGSLADFGSASTSDEIPSTSRLRTIPTRPASSIGLRPTRSMMRMATIVIATFSTPITRFA
jgi:hypothetical protein